MSSTVDAQLLFNSNCVLGEGPCWQTQTQSLFWVDILGKKLFKSKPFKDSTYEQFEMDQQIGTVAPCAKDNSTMIVALQKGIYSYNLNSKESKCIANPEEHLPNNRFNDGKCDPQGRFWAGTMSMLLDSSGASQEPLAGSVYCIDSDFSIKKKN